MNLLENLGIYYSGSYINQGSIEEKCSKSNNLNIKYTELVLNTDGKDMSFDNISKIYNGQLIYHLPTININGSNLKDIRELLTYILKTNIKLLVINASTLLYETYDWSTEEEQQNYLKNMAKGIALIASNNIAVAIENTDYLQDNLLFGKSATNISDLLVYSRNALVEEYNLTRENANNLIGISINIGNLKRTNEISNLDNWFKIFYNDIKVIEIDNIENSIPLYNQLLDLIIQNNIDVPLLLDTNDDLENIDNQYNKFLYLTKNKLEGKPLNLDQYRNIVSVDNKFTIESSQRGYTNLIIVLIIILTTISAILMCFVKLGN